MKTEHPVHIMVFWVLTNDDDMILFILLHGLRFITEAYIKYLEEDQYGGYWKMLCLQQDFVP